MESGKLINCGVCSEMYPRHRVWRMASGDFQCFRCAFIHPQIDLTKTADPPAIIDLTAEGEKGDDEDTEMVDLTNE